MRALVRLAGVGIVGVALYFIGQAQGIVQVDPDPHRAPAVAVVVLFAIALALLVWLASGTGSGDSRTPGSRWQRMATRALWLAVSGFAFLGLAMLVSVADPPPPHATVYHNDAVALNECAAGLLLRGHNPYAELDLFECYERLGIGPDRTTPLKRGLLRDVAVYPSDDALQAAWALRRGSPAEKEPARPGEALPPGRPSVENLEFVWRPSYPALSFLAVVPWTLARLDPNLLSFALLLLGMALVLARAEPSLRGLVLTALLANLVGIAYTIGGSSDLLWAAPLVAAWLWRERRWSALALGLAAAAKQLAWFAAPYYALAVYTRFGLREAARRMAAAAAVFAVANLPFAVADPAAWFAGLATPVNEPMFPLGAGLVFLATTGVMPLLPSWAYVGMELAAIAGCFAVAWRLRRTSPEVGIVLAYLPLFFAWRSLFSYFYLLPLFAAAAVARMPVGALEREVARRLGAVSLADAGPLDPATDERPGGRALPRPAASFSKDGPPGGRALPGRAASLSARDPAAAATAAASGAATLSGASTAALLAGVRQRAEPR